MIPAFSNQAANRIQKDLWTFRNLLELENSNLTTDRKNNNKEGVWGGSSTFKEDSTGDIHKDTRERKHKSLNDLSIN